MGSLGSRTGSRKDSQRFSNVPVSRFAQGDVVVLHRGARIHEKLRPFIGLPGEVVVIEEIGSVIVRYVGTDVLRVAPGLLLKAEDQTVEPYSGPARTFAVTLPLPPGCCSPNYRGHTVTRSRHIAAYREGCKQAFLDANIPALRLPVRVDLTYYLYRPAYLGQGRYSPTDEDNGRGAAKAAQDALTLAGVISDDRSPNVRSGDVVLHRNAPAHQNKAELLFSITEILEVAK
jgi:hypothetical protein